MVGSPELKNMFAVVILSLCLSGCGTLTQREPDTQQPPLRTYENLVGVRENLLEVDDSLERGNRSIYRFNYYFDRYLFIPTVRSYEFVVPEYVQSRLSNAFDNLGEFGNLTNSLLQLKFGSAGIAVGRFVVNSTVGIAGFWDPASGWGLTRQPRNFGQTLGRYGAGSGSYLVLPIFGPSNIRDSLGLLADTAAFSLVGPAALWANDTAASIAYSGTSAVDKRHRVSFRYRQTGSPFEYELLRKMNSMKIDFSLND